MNARLKYCCLQ